MVEFKMLFKFDDFKTDDVLIGIAKKHGGIDVGSGLGPDGREIVFEFNSQHKADVAEREMYDFVKQNTNNCFDKKV